MSILSAIWPWRKRKGRTTEQFDTRGRRRIVCLGSRSPVTGEITERWNRTHDEWIRYALCSECGFDVRVTGPNSRPQLTVHKGKGY